MAGQYFPEQAIAVLQAARFNPLARPGLQLLSGALLWNDEANLEFVPVCRDQGCLAYWEPLLFRSSLIRGQPDESCRRGWDELMRACPGWPGFGPERRSESWKAEFERQLAEGP